MFLFFLYAWFQIYIQILLSSMCIYFGFLIFYVHIDMVGMAFLHLSGLSKTAGKIHSGCHSRFESFSQDMFGLFSSLHNSEQIKSLYAHILPGLWEREACCSCVGSTRCVGSERGRRKRDGERKRMRWVSFANRIRGRCFLLLAGTKIKLHLFRSLENSVAPCY